MFVQLFFKIVIKKMKTTKTIKIYFLFENSYQTNP